MLGEHDGLEADPTHDAKTETFLGLYKHSHYGICQASQLIHDVLCVMCLHLTNILLVAIKNSEKKVL